MSHHVLLEFPCNPGRGADFLGALLPALAETRAYDGCEHVETFTDQDNPDTILLKEKWASREHQEAYMNWRIETGMMEAIGPLLTGPPRIVHLAAAE